eukprot:gene8641-9573_t
MDHEMRILNYNMAVVNSKLADMDKRLETLRKIEKNTRYDPATEMTWLTNCKGKVDVYVRVSILAVGDIDTVNQQFVCELFLSLRWEDPELQNMVGKNKDIDWQSYWEPGIYFINLVQFEKFDRNQTLYKPRQFLMALQNAASTFLLASSPKRVQVFEWVSFVILGSILILIHAVFGFYCHKYTRKATLKLLKYSQEYNKGKVKEEYKPPKEKEEALRWT